MVLLAGGGIGTLAFVLPSPKRGANVCVRETATDFSSCFRAACGCTVSGGFKLPRGAWGTRGAGWLPPGGTGTLAFSLFSPKQGASVCVSLPLTFPARPHFCFCAACGCPGWPGRAEVPLECNRQVLGFSISWGLSFKFSGTLH